MFVKNMVEKRLVREMHARTCFESLFGKQPLAVACNCGPVHFRFVFAFLAVI